MSVLMGNSISYIVLVVPLAKAILTGLIVCSIVIFKPNNSKLWLGLLFVSNIIMPLT